MQVLSSGDTFDPDYNLANLISTPYHSTILRNLATGQHLHIQNWCALRCDKYLCGPVSGLEMVLLA